MVITSGIVMSPSKQAFVCNENFDEMHPHAITSPYIMTLVDHNGEYQDYRNFGRLRIRFNGVDDRIKYLTKP
jgi:hypothetical protein